MYKLSFQLCDSYAFKIFLPGKERRPEKKVIKKNNTNIE